MKTAEEILRKNLHDTENGIHSCYDQVYEVANEIIASCEEYASQFKQSVPITDAEINKIIEDNVVRDSDWWFKLTNDDISDITKELKDRLQSDAVCFGEFILNTHKYQKDGTDKWVNDDNGKYITTQKLYNSQEFKDYKNNLNK